MEKHRALIVGAGRIGAGWNWADDAYTHAGAYMALKDRVSLVGFVEPDEERAIAAQNKWGVPCWDRLESALQSLKPDVVSVCTQPEDQLRILPVLDVYHTVNGIWCEKPYMGYPAKKPVQVNYLRRGCPEHQFWKNRRWTNRRGDEEDYPVRLVVYGKDDLTTRCHFEDLAKWWDCDLDYRPFQGPCAYVLETSDGKYRFFDAGGVDAGYCMKAMLGNLLDHLDNLFPLWSPAHDALRS